MRISVGYLSLVERDRVPAPSAEILHFLALALKQDFDELMALASRPVPPAPRRILTPELSRVLGAAANLGLTSDDLMGMLGNWIVSTVEAL
jgi:hypothetical protein